VIERESGGKFSYKNPLLENIPALHKDLCIFGYICDILPLFPRVDCTEEILLLKRESQQRIEFTNELQ
jgi:hypothetical protein